MMQGHSLAALASFTPANQNDVITQVNSIGSLLTKYYLYIFLVFILLAFILPDEWPSRSVSPIIFKCNPGTCCINPDIHFYQHLKSKGDSRGYHIQNG